MCPGFLVRISHAAMAACRSALFLFRNVGDEGLSGKHQRSDGAGIGEGSAYDLRRIEHASLNQVPKFPGQSIEAEVRVLGIGHFTKHNRTLFTSILGNLTERFLQSTL